MFILRFISSFSQKNVRFFLIKISCFSVPLAFCPLGEEEFSFAYDGRGKKVSGGTEKDYGEPFTEGDIIGCYAVSDTFLIWVFRIRTLWKFTVVSLSCDMKIEFYKSVGHRFILITTVCACDSLSPQTELLNSLSIRTVGSWVWPFRRVRLRRRVMLCFLTSSVGAVQWDSIWTPQLLRGIPALQGLHLWQPFSLSREFAPRWALPPELSVRWEISSRSIWMWIMERLYA